MAVKVELTETELKNAIELQIASTKRQINTTKQMKFKPILEDELKRYQVALGSITETK